MKKIIIGIQARSTSTRFPRKIFQMIDGKEVLAHVIEAAQKSCDYINRYRDKSHTRADIVILCPHGDELVEKYKYNSMIFQGDESNVLKRYYDMAKCYKSDFIVRITSDCPLIPPYLITKHVNVAVKKNMDYVSNVDEDVRTTLDGHDVEVMSFRALEWAYYNAENDLDREHVTLVLRSKNVPSDFRVGHVIGHIYNPHIKLSIDTPEDLERVRREYGHLQGAIDKAQKKNGTGSVHRF